MGNPDNDHSDSIGIIGIQEKNAQTLTDIQDLQTVELELFNNLETGIANKSLSTAQKQSIIDQIEKISKMRETLYKNIEGLQKFFQKNVTFASTTLNEQVGAIQIIEKELNEATTRYKIIQEDKNNKFRLVEINTYYGDKYNDHASIMKSIVVICIPIIFITILANYGFLPSIVYTILLIIIGVVGIIHLGLQISESLSHDNMNYQEYDWGSKTPTNPPAINVGDLTTAKDPWSTNGLTCIGQSCCDTAFTYVPAPANKCVSNSKLPKGVSPYVPPDSSSSTASSAV